MELARISGVALAKAIKTRKISSEEATRAALKRLRSADEEFGIALSIEDGEALKAARAIDAMVADKSAKGALAGVPVAHKDMFDRAGKIASWGARIRADKPARTDATVIARLKETGAVQIGALHLTEFAFGPTGHNYVLGHARNPWDPTRITGGSSAGTAAAVAAGVIPAGFGSDTGGSLRVPAACCNVMSIKPTYTRISRAGAMPLSPQLDTIGIIARHAEAYLALSRAFAGREVEKRYLAIVHGAPKPPSGTIDAAIGRHPERRQEMAVRTDRGGRAGRPAITLYRTLATVGGLSLLELDLRTGRTHQIRVHAKFLGHPLVGDPTYGEARWKALPKSRQAVVRDFPRPALHAWRLEFDHPKTSERMRFEAPVPSDLVELWERGTGQPFPGEI